MTSDVTPRVRIERNLAMSLLMQLDGADPATVNEMLPAYELADTLEGRAAISTDRIIAVLGLDPDGEDGAACRASLLEWFTANDAEIDQD